MRLVFAALLCFIPALAAAQTIHPLIHEGDRVRITARADTGIFTVRSVTPDTLTVVDPAGGEARFPLASVTRLERSKGQLSLGRRLAKRAGIGLLIGGGAGVMIGAMDGDDDSRGMAFALTAQEKMVLGGLTLGSLGAIAATLTGFGGSREAWERVELDHGVSLRPTARGALVVAYSFQR